MQTKKRIINKLLATVGLVLYIFAWHGRAQQNQGTDTGNAKVQIYASNDLTIILCNRLKECGAGMTDADCKTFSFSVQNTPAKYGLGVGYNNFTLNDVYNDEVGGRLTFNLNTMLSCSSELAAISCSAAQITTFIADAPNFLPAKYLSILNLPTTCKDVFK